MISALWRPWPGNGRNVITGRRTAKASMADSPPAFSTTTSAAANTVAMSSVHANAAISGRDWSRWRSRRSRPHGTTTRQWHDSTKNFTVFSISPTPHEPLVTTTTGRSPAAVVTPSAPVVSNSRNRARASSRDNGCRNAGATNGPVGTA